MATSHPRPARGLVRGCAGIGAQLGFDLAGIGRGNAHPVGHDVADQRGEGQRVGVAEILPMDAGEQQQRQPAFRLRVW